MPNTHVMCADFIKLNLNKGFVWDAMEAVQYLNKRWGMNFDWHEMAYALDSLYRDNTIFLYPFQRTYKKYEIATPKTILEGHYLKDE